MPLKSIAIQTVPRAALAMLLTLPCMAFAQVQAYTNQPVNLMSGPDDSYPIVTGLGPNQPVTVMGCVSDYSWCDVALDDLRGWIYGDAIAYPYEGNYVPLDSYGAVIGLPVVVFSIDSYWGHYYQGRPWYGDRDRWRNMPPHQPGYGGGRPPGNGNGYGGHPPGNGPGGPGNGYGDRTPPAQGGQPVYRPQTSPMMPPRGPQGQPQPQQDYGRPPVQGQPQPQYGRPPVQGQPQGQPQGAPQARPQQPQPQYARPQAQQPQYARPQPQAQPQGRGGPNPGRQEPPQN